MLELPKLLVSQKHSAAHRDRILGEQIQPSLRDLEHAATHRFKQLGFRQIELCPLNAVPIDKLRAAGEELLPFIGGQSELIREHVVGIS